MEGTLKRLYVGGIGPSVTKAELTERFGKFGKVDDVDIISRKDEQGNPIKTFAYININVSDAELKKCMSLLNKTKWKGGQIQIEMAKESFLDRLSQERQKAKEKEEAKSRRRSQTDLVQSLEKAGVTDFQMKSAVPGTEVPNHKNWVVSKFGRVLPVLHLNGSKQSKSMKYDPSKFCHNIKKIDDDSFETVPVSKLTWQLEGGDDEISKKRRGEFPAFKSPPKKASKFLVKGDVSNRKMSTRVPSAFVPQSVYESHNARKPQQTKIRGHLVTKSINSMTDEEYDSEEELQAVLQRERTRMGSVDHAEDSNVEVVDDSFELSYTTHWGKRDAKAQKPDLSTQGDKEYDSADTDEIITVAKTTQDDCRSDKKKKATVVKIDNSSLKVHNKKQASTVGLGAKSLHKPKATEPESESDNESSAAERSDSISDEEYDSEKELQAVLQREKARIGSVDHAEDSNVEVVDDSFELSYTTHWGKRDAKAQKPDLSTQGDEEYDSADTDEIITVAKTTQDDCRSDKKKKRTVLKNDNSLNIHNKKQASTVGLGAKSLHKPKATVFESEFDSESSASGAESSDSFSDEEYEAMMQNCYRLDLTMGDLEAMSKEAVERDSDDISEDEEYESESDSANTSQFTKRTSPKPDKCSPDNSAKEQKPNHKLISEAVKDKQKAKTLHRGEFNGPSEKVETDDSDSDSCQQMDSTKPKSCGNNIEIKMLKAKSVTPKPSLVKAHKQEDVSEDEEGEENVKKEGPGYQKIRKVTKRGIEPDDIVASILEDGDSEEEEGKPKKRAVKPSLVKDHIKENISEDETVDNKKKKDPGSQPVKNITKKRGIEPDDIVASILEDSGSDDERPKHKRKKGPPVNLPEFKGLGSLMASSSPSSSSLSAKFCGQATPVSEDSSEGNSNKRTSGDTKKGKTEEPGRDLRKKLPEAKQESTSSSDTSSDDDSSTDSSPTTSPAGKSCATPTVSIKDQPASEAKQKKDNQKRLAAMEERRKERELQKKTIQGALLKMESQASKKTQHIVFSSESGTESEKEEQKPTSETKVLPNDSKAKQGAAKLFDSSEEDSGSEDEKNDERFEIKAQYEGRSGEKLMRLQSRFGTDERFKMDSRFLESSSDDEDASEEAQKSPGDAEDDLSAEKKKNLSILQSIMNVNVETRPTSKRAEKAKKFKDLNALHYDPTKEDHEEFETKAEEKKESKSERKKKRLEAEKLPEVSKDTYHEINVDLKEVFSTFKPQGAEQAEVTWDQQLEPEKIEEEDTSDKDFSFQNQAQEPAGFTFSFFGNNEEENVPSNEPYKTETIKPAKVVWQEDPRFQDSSSGEDEEEDKSMAVDEKPSAQPATSSIRFFFFVKDDERLKTGPKTFCRSSITEPEDWEQRRDSLLEECRKRHKDAKRKIKTKH
ncbi:nucleolar protein 8 [Hyperolius riggenbachi]|uniref:nucleolar protein 8 n=1 Tax=Hyperolius riggenbachi TaxID=752182 RepID=UPI0035A3BA6A